MSASTCPRSPGLDEPIRFILATPHPDLAHDTFDVVLARHVIWALPNPDEALRRWAALLKPDGRLIAIEGRWGSAGIAPLFDHIEHHPLASDPDLWERTVDDERYALIATRPTRSSR